MRGPARAFQGRGLPRPHGVEEKMRTSNVQHPTSNVQHRTGYGKSATVRRSMFSVQCSAFGFLMPGTGTETRKNANVQHPTSNVQHRTGEQEAASGSPFDVQCSMFSVRVSFCIRDAWNREWGTNYERPTSNVERPTSNRRTESRKRFAVRCSVFDVQRSRFLMPVNGEKMRIE